MTTYIKKFMALNLQLFAEGGTGAVNSSADNGGFAAPTTDVNDNPLANVKYGKQKESVQTVDAQNEGTDVAPVNRKEEYKKLIKGDYKDLYDADVQDKIKKRLRGSQEQLAKFEKLAPVLDILGKKHGVDVNDVDALIKAVEEDNSYFEEEAMRLGTSVENVKFIHKIERENAALKQANAAREGAERYQKWLNEAEDVKRIYPDFDFETELNNDQFKRCLQSGVGVKAAFQAVHHDEIIPAAMQYAAKTAEKKLADNIAANKSRPTENGITSQSAALVKTDVSQFKDADLEEIIRRVKRGERIEL